MNSPDVLAHFQEADTNVSFRDDMSSLNFQITTIVPKSTNAKYFGKAGKFKKRLNI